MWRYPLIRNPNIKPRSRRNWTRILRQVSQLAFLVFILAASLRHSLFEANAVTASIDALCPLGGLETLWQAIVTGGTIPKTHASNLVLGLGLLLGAILGGAAFCGWICPFGTLQDGLTSLRKKLHISELHVPAKMDRWLRYGRFLILGLILYKTISSAQLWFSGYDPYRTIFGLGWIFEFNLAESWAAYLIALIVLGASFMVPRAWCKYACPLGGALSLVGNFSLLRIRRNREACKSCAICETPCPVGIAVAKARPSVSTNCIGCLECVQACPRQGALEVQMAPAWWSALKRVFRKPAHPMTVSGD
jgi:NapH/MauN family ferredoxin-type protein